jgi:hypothetical protein
MKMFDIHNQKSLTSSLASKNKALTLIFEKKNSLPQSMSLISKLECEIQSMTGKMDERVIKETLSEVSIEAVRNLILENQKVCQNRLK